MIRRLKYLLVLLCLVSFSVRAEDDKVTLNFVNADVVSVIKAVGKITGRNFLIDPRVRGTVNIVSSKPVSHSLIYPILLSALRLQGFAAVESNGITKILPEADAKLNSGTLLLEKKPAHGGELVTQVYTLKNQSASQIVPVLRPLIAPNNTISAYPNGNALVITDYADNLKRIDSIIDAIDQSGGPDVIPLLHASAFDLAQTVNKLMNEGVADPGQRLVAVADPRTNSLVLRSGNTAAINIARNLVAKLDTQTSESGNIHVVYLKNASAASLAKTLRGALTGEAAPSAPASKDSHAAVATPTSTSSGGGMIEADVDANALIITAPDAIYNNLRAAIDKLDVRQAEIYVEALVAEVNVNKAAEFGVQWQYLNGVNGTTAQAIGGTNFGTAGGGANILGAAANLTSVGQGLNIGVMKGQVNIPGVGQILNLGLLARALQTDADANILSTPNLLTLDNEEAKIVVGQNVPFITGSYAQTGTTTTTVPFQTYERQDVGLMLKIKPQISAGNIVRLKIYQEVSSVDPTTLNNAAGPTTNKRSIDSTVVVDDGQIVVLGGLIQDSVSDNVSKVPLLGDIPVLGNLFSYKSRTHNKTNLMVFLSPHILRNAKSYQGLTTERYDYITGVQSKSQPETSFLLPNVKAPVLPPLKK